MKTTLLWLMLGAGSVFACNKSDEAATARPSGITSIAPALLPGSAQLPEDPQATPQASGIAQAPLLVAERADTDMLQVLAELDSLVDRPLTTLSAEEARKQPGPLAAVTSLLKRREKLGAPIEMAKVENRQVPGAAGKVDARIYTPISESKTLLPVVAFWHGGGFVLGNLDDYDVSARALALESEAIVVSLDYRRAPENKFPAAHDDAFASFKWLQNNAESFGGDARRIAVAGESAGANLALNVAIAARAAGILVPCHQLLIYPLASGEMNSQSYQEWANAKPLNKSLMAWFFENYLRGPEDALDPRIQLLAAPLAQLRATTIILAEIDPLRSEGEQLAQKLRQADVLVNVKTYNGVTHEFFGMRSAVADAIDAEHFAGEHLKNAFN